MGSEAKAQGGHVRHFLVSFVVSSLWTTPDFENRPDNGLDPLTKAASHQPAVNPVAPPASVTELLSNGKVCKSFK